MNRHIEVFGKAGSYSYYPRIVSSVCVRAIGTLGACGHSRPHNTIVAEMYEQEKQLTTVEPEKREPAVPSRLGAGLGCVGSGVIVFGCIIGILGHLCFFGVYYGPLHPPIEVRDSLILRAVFTVGFVAAGVIPFVCLVVLLHTTILFPYVPHSTRKWWYLATVVGAIAYWLTFWYLWANLLGAFGGFDEMMRKTEGDIPATIGATFLASCIGAIMTFASTLPLATLQWLALRRSVPNAARWSGTLLIGNSLVTGIVIGLFSWGTRWGWN